MKKKCQNFRRQLSEHLPEKTVRKFLKQATHQKDCSECQQYLKEFIVTEEFLTDAKASGIPEPDYQYLRKKVWDTIEDNQNESAFFPQRILKPAVVTLTAVLIIGVSIIYFSQQPFDRSGYSDIAAELDEMFVSESISEDDLVVAVNESDLSEEILTYFVERSAYDVVQDVYSTREEWKDIAAELAAMEL